MDSFVIPRKRVKEPLSTPPPPKTNPEFTEDDEDSTDLKLATLSSLFPGIDQATFLDLLISTDGSVNRVVDSLSGNGQDSNVISPCNNNTKRKLAIASVGVGYQTSLSAFRKSEESESKKLRRGLLTRKGQTLHLYSAEDIAAHTPCSIIHNFLPAREADSLLRELLQEAPTFQRQTFKMFDNVVQSPHSACFYVDSLEEREKQKTEYLYNGSYLEVSLGVPRFAAENATEFLTTDSNNCRMCANSRPRCELFPVKSSQLSMKKLQNASFLTTRTVKSSSFSHHMNGSPMLRLSIATKGVMKV